MKVKVILFFKVRIQKEVKIQKLLLPLRKMQVQLPVLNRLILKSSQLDLKKVCHTVIYAET
ncbi:hypothetical protein BER93_07800 [Xanthomonas fragariae]|nr:hypothetical protein BER92_07775 [Xanthomonas fragariae]AOD18043.1 hypothetical protein BER93_07800 [Xanthomonas fragariae]